MKNVAIILSLLAATGLAIPMEQAQQAQQADQSQMLQQTQMMHQMQMAANDLFDPPRNGNGNIIADIFDTASCIIGGFIGSRTCTRPATNVIHLTSDDHHSHNDNSSTSSSSTSSSYQYNYSTDSDGNYHITITPGGGKASCNYTVSKEDAQILATTINQLAAKCLSK
ncbi:hypothetical protein TARUN_778 [Trichoderma arundinaceum]|uniref:Uncharacterized protein n=1 Tax=Trichoderma arundinaceum TaxID=490622 RepID=A0A395NZA0_TRIAR|nr:hypothetical protein TARUN_778 [Trichoderma arundinaceum]